MIYRNTYYEPNTTLYRRTMQLVILFMVMDMVIVPAMLYVDHKLGYIFGSLMVLSHIYISILRVQYQGAKDLKHYRKGLHITTNIPIGNNNHMYIQKTTGNIVKIFS